MDENIPGLSTKSSIILRSHIKSKGHFDGFLSCEEQLLVGENPVPWLIERLETLIESNRGKIPDISISFWEEDLANFRALQAD